VQQGLQCNFRNCFFSCWLLMFDVFAFFDTLIALRRRFFLGKLHSLTKSSCDWYLTCVKSDTQPSYLKVNIVRYRDTAHASPYTVDLDYIILETKSILLGRPLPVAEHCLTMKSIQLVKMVLIKSKFRIRAPSARAVIFLYVHLCSFV
jgi:hypothetical protein